MSDTVTTLVHNQHIHSLFEYNNNTANVRHCDDTSSQDAIHSLFEYNNNTANVRHCDDTSSQSTHTDYNGSVSQHQQRIHVRVRFCDITGRTPVYAPVLDSSG